jgi:hypothetical protein
MRLNLFLWHASLKATRGIKNGFRREQWNENACGLRPPAFHSTEHLSRDQCSKDLVVHVCNVLVDSRSAALVVQHDEARALLAEQERLSAALVIQEDEARAVLARQNAWKWLWTACS